jgi:hypothetical protein
MCVWGVPQGLVEVEQIQTSLSYESQLKAWAPLSSSWAWMNGGRQVLAVADWILACSFSLCSWSRDPPLTEPPLDQNSLHWHFLDRDLISHIIKASHSSYENNPPGQLCHLVMFAWTVLIPRTGGEASGRPGSCYFWPTFLCAKESEVSVLASKDFLWLYWVYPVSLRGHEWLHTKKCCPVLQH